MQRGFWWAALGYIIVSMVLAMPWHFVWFHDLYHQLGIYNRPAPIIPSPGRAVCELFRALGAQTIRISLDELVHTRKYQTSVTANGRFQKDPKNLVSR